MENGEQSEVAKLDDLVKQLQVTIRRATHGVLGMDDEGDFICGCCGKKLTPEAAVAINKRLAEQGLGGGFANDPDDPEDTDSLGQPL